MLLLTLLAPLAGTCDVLYWEVNESSKVDGGDIRLFLAPYTVDDDHFVSARVVKLTNGNGTILDIWGEDEYGNSELWDGSIGIELGDSGSGRWVQNGFNLRLATRLGKQQPIRRM